MSSGRTREQSSNKEEESNDDRPVTRYRPSTFTCRTFAFGGGGGGSRNYLRGEMDRYKRPKSGRKSSISPKRGSSAESTGFEPLAEFAESAEENENHALGDSVDRSKWKEKVEMRVTAVQTQAPKLVNRATSSGITMNNNHEDRNNNRRRNANSSRDSIMEKLINNKISKRSFEILRNWVVYQVENVQESEDDEEYEDEMVDDEDEEPLESEPEAEEESDPDDAAARRKKKSSRTSHHTRASNASSMNKSKKTGTSTKDEDEDEFEADYLSQPEGSSMNDSFFDREVQTTPTPGKASFVTSEQHSELVSKRKSEKTEDTKTPAESPASLPPNISPSMFQCLPPPPPGCCQEIRVDVSQNPPMVRSQFVPCPGGGSTNICKPPDTSSAQSKCAPASTIIYPDQFASFGGYYCNCSGQSNRSGLSCRLGQIQQRACCQRCRVLNYCRSILGASVGRMLHNGCNSDFREGGTGKPTYATPPYQVDHCGGNLEGGTWKSEYSKEFVDWSKRGSQTGGRGGGGYAYALDDGRTQGYQGPGSNPQDKISGHPGGIYPSKKFNSNYGISGSTGNPISSGNNGGGGIPPNQRAIPFKVGSNPNEYIFLIGPGGTLISGAGLDGGTSQTPKENGTDGNTAPFPAIKSQNHDANTQAGPATPDKDLEWTSHKFLNAPGIPEHETRGNNGTSKHAISSDFHMNPDLQDWERDSDASWVTMTDEESNDANTNNGGSDEQVDSEADKGGTRKAKTSDAGTNPDPNIIADDQGNIRDKRKTPFPHKMKGQVPKVKSEPIKPPSFSDDGDASPNKESRVKFRATKAEIGSPMTGKSPAPTTKSGDPKKDSPSNGTAIPFQNNSLKDESQKPNAKSNPSKQNPASSKGGKGSPSPNPPKQAGDPAKVKKANGNDKDNDDDSGYNVMVKTTTIKKKSVPSAETDPNGPKSGDKSTKGKPTPSKEPSSKPQDGVSKQGVPKDKTLPPKEKNANDKSKGEPSKDPSTNKALPPKGNQDDSDKTKNKTPTGVPFPKKDVSQKAPPSSKSPKKPTTKNGNDKDDDVESGSGYLMVKTTTTTKKTNVASEIDPDKAKKGEPAKGKADPPKEASKGQPTKTGPASANPGQKGPPQKPAQSGKDDGDDGSGSGSDYLMKKTTTTRKKNPVGSDNGSDAPKPDAKNHPTSKPPAARPDDKKNGARNSTDSKSSGSSKTGTGTGSSSSGSSGMIMMKTTTIRKKTQEAVEEVPTPSEFSEPPTPPVTSAQPKKK